MLIAQMCQAMDGDFTFVLNNLQGFFGPDSDAYFS
jgi:hypothetical protein